MSCNCNDEHGTYFNDNCVCNVVQFIHELQECTSANYSSDYDLPLLGPSCKVVLANTRPFILFTKSGKPFEAYIPSTGPNCFTPIFRVESVDEDCCAVLRALIVFTNGEPNPTTDPVCTYLTTPQAELRATSSCVTVDLHCFCGIQCLRDASVSNC